MSHRGPYRNNSSQKFSLNSTPPPLNLNLIFTGRPSPLDPQDSYFRVRLVCVLLDTCGHYFDHGSTKKKLDTFLVFFQCYLFTKRQPLPLEVDHMVQDTIEGLRPNLEMFKSHQEAVEAAMELERKYKDKIGKRKYDVVDISIFMLTKHMI